MYSQSIVDLRNEKIPKEEVTNLLNIDTYSVFNGPDYKIYTPKSANNFKSDQQKAKVTLVFKCPNDITPTSMAVYGKDFPVTNINYDNKTKAMSYNIELPIGKVYSMHALFKGRPTRSFYVFKENIKIDKDTTITFDQEEATNTIKVTSVDENGTVLTPDLYDGGKKIPGNAKSFSTTSFFAHKDYGVIMTILGGAYKVKGYDIDYYTNKVSENYHLYQGRQIGTKDGIRYFIGFDIPLGQEKIEIQNDPKAFKSYEQKFSSSKTGEVKESHIPGYYLYTTYEGSPVVGSRSYNTSTVLNEPVIRCMASNTVSKDGKFVYLVAPLYGDERIEKTVNGKPNYTFKFINGTPMYTDREGNLVSSVYGYGVYTGFSVVENTNKQKVFPGNPAFSFLLKPENNYVYGNNCPILSAQLTPKGTSISIKTTYVGRYGEIREADLSNLKREQKEENGFNTLTFINENPIIDGIPGKNETSINLKIGATDNLAPTIQMLQFRDKAGLITDRFTTNKEGIINIAGGDFDYHLHSDGRTAFYSFKNASLKVYSASHNSDNWKELKAELDENKFYMPGYGNFYNVDLAQMESGAKGWYDIKLEITDEAGNKQIQKIRPAFHLAFDVATTDIINDNIDLKISNNEIYVDGTTNARLAIYSMDGIMISDQHATSISIKNLHAGIYIVKAITSNGTKIKKFVK